MKPHRNPQEDERLGLSRRSFFFFGAILAAKPEIVVAEPPISPLLSVLANARKIPTATSLRFDWHERTYSRQGKLHELHLASGDVLVLPSRITNMGRNPVMARVDRFDAAGRPLLTALSGRGATTREIDCGEWLVVGQAYREDV